MARRLQTISAHLQQADAVASSHVLPSVQHKMLINGELMHAESGGTLDVVNPATGKVFDRVPNASRSDLDAAVAGAKAAFLTWKVRRPRSHFFVCFITVLSKSAT